MSEQWCGVLLQCQLAGAAGLAWHQHFCIHAAVSLWPPPVTHVRTCWHVFHFSTCFFCICCFLHLLFSPTHIISGCSGLCSCNGLVRVDREASVLFDCFKLPLWPLSFLARRCCACSQAHLFVYVASCRTCCPSQAVCKWFLSHAHILQYVWDKNVYSQRVSSFLLIWSRARGAVQWVPRGATLGFCTLLGTASQGCSQQLVRWFQ
jgi:hypothetical protein